VQSDARFWVSRPADQVLAVGLVEVMDDVYAELVDDEDIVVEREIP
jgi:hypothetical protein